MIEDTKEDTKSRLQKVKEIFHNNFYVQMIFIVFIISMIIVFIQCKPNSHSKEKLQENIIEEKLLISKNNLILIF